MRILTFGTEEKRLARLRASLTQEIVNAGAGLVYRGLMQKVHEVERFIGVLEDSEIVLFVDGYDVVFSEKDCVGEIESRFRSWGVPFLMSAETNCYPYPTEEEYPLCETPYRFLNSGCYIGYAGEMRRLFDEMRISRIPSYLNDQAIFTDLYLFRGGIVLDHEASLFMSLFGAEDDLRCEEGRYINTVTGSRPLVLHGNGGVDMDNFLRRGE